MTDTVIIIYLALLGAALGSFAGAVAWRLFQGKDFVRDRSECEHCHHKLAVGDLIPIFSWLWLRGKCRYCRHRIGWQPLILELSLSLAFVVSYIAWPFELSSALDYSLLATWLAALLVMSMLFVTDLRWKAFSSNLLWLLVAIGLVMFAMRAWQADWSFGESLLELGLGLLPVAGLYYVLYKVSNEKWVGKGDYKLGIFIGAALGWQGALLVLMLSNVIGLLVIMPLLLTGRLGPKSRVPFGPFLITAVFIAFLWSDGLIGAYINLISI